MRSLRGLCHPVTQHAKAYQLPAASSVTVPSRVSEYSNRLMLHDRMWACHRVHRLARHRGHEVIGPPRAGMVLQEDR
jgi:hypothetical protein